MDNLYWRIDDSFQTYTHLTEQCKLGVHAHALKISYNVLREYPGMKNSIKMSTQYKQLKC